MISVKKLNVVIVYGGLGIRFRRNVGKEYILPKNVHSVKNGRVLMILSAIMTVHRNLLGNSVR